MKQNTQTAEVTLESGVPIATKTLVLAMSISLVVGGGGVGDDRY